MHFKVHIFFVIMRQIMRQNLKLCKIM